jgi:hypothetical protein
MSDGYFRYWYDQLKQLSFEIHVRFFGRKFDCPICGGMDLLPRDERYHKCRDCEFLFKFYDGKWFGLRYDEKGYERLEAIVDEGNS